MKRKALVEAMVGSSDPSLLKGWGDGGSGNLMSERGWELPYPPALIVVAWGRSRV
ncbi:hypothetical protein TRIUR3_07505 [Triticum urartu]|uniref:Uncharacterized protein n=1 Tax=Triticum urartu TaxID=4572 RepID=M7ZQI5_TRIUA|nr:hypothetical protein TRIUR3_07505 [Triticum urartu]